MYQEQFHFALNAYWLGLSDADSSEIQGIQNLVFLTPKQAANYLHLSSKTIWNHTFYEIVAEEIRQEKLVDRLYTRIFASPDFLKKKKHHRNTSDEDSNANSNRNKCRWWRC